MIQLGDFQQSEMNRVFKPQEDQEEQMSQDLWALET